MPTASCSAATVCLRRPRSTPSAFRFLETADEHVPYAPDPVPPQGRWAISCLDLPEDVLERVYAGNARRLLAAR